MRLRILTIILMAFAIVACDTESPYSGYSANFSFDTSFAPFNQVTGFGQFITVRRKSSTSYEVTDAMGNTTVRQLSENEVRRKFYYGLGGFIIGTPSLGDGTVWAYDLACPECDMARYRLELDDVGRASCGHCGSVFDLNSGGIPIIGKARTMWRYRVTPNGTYMTIHN